LAAVADDTDITVVDEALGFSGKDGIDDSVSKEALYVM
jgi:hypothetical protein